jgi:hypothetical protein
VLNEYTLDEIRARPEYCSQKLLNVMHRRLGSKFTQLKKIVLMTTFYSSDKNVCITTESTPDAMWVSLVIC